MANAKGSANVRNIIQTGKMLPPKIPFPSPSPAYSDYNSNPLLGSKVISGPKDFIPYHQRTVSESFLVEEQPSWLDDLLDEPETPVRRGHRRSSSDSFSYADLASLPNMDYASTLQNESKYKNLALSQLWGSQNMDHYKDFQRRSFCADPNSFGKPRSNTLEWPLNSATHSGTLISSRENRIRLSAGSWPTPQKADTRPPTGTDKQDYGEPGLPNTVLPENDGAHANMASENDTKRAKQQFAQRSRVRKLQYIAELESNVQALQAEGSDASAELEFLGQQKLIMSMENKALKQRLESLAQEQLIKRLEHEMLEREIGRLRALYQQQQNHHQPNQRQTSHKRTSSKDFDTQFANLSLKHKDVSSGADTIRT